MELSNTDLRKIAGHTVNLSSADNRLSETDAAVVWQYVRFNSIYQSEYTKLKNKVKRTSDEEAEDFLVQIFCETWGMSEAIDFKMSIPPKKFYFDRRMVRASKNLRVFQSIANWEHDNLFLSVNISGDRKLIEQQVLDVLRSHHRESNSNVRIKGSSLSHLTDNFICFYLKTVLNLRNKEIKQQYKELKAGGTLQDAQINSKVESFKRNSAKAPWCFFAAHD